MEAFYNPKQRCIVDAAKTIRCIEMYWKVKCQLRFQVISICKILAGRYTTSFVITALT